MFPFYAVSFSVALSEAERGVNSLALFQSGQYGEQQAWQDAQAGLAALVSACQEIEPLKQWSGRLWQDRAKPHSAH